MPVSRFQSDVLAVIASARDQQNFVAGGVPINRLGPRTSSDIDIFLDREERVIAAAEQDAETLRGRGFSVTWLRRSPAIVSATIERGGETTKLEWVTDSDFRYFPAGPDPQFGYVLSVPDLAVNKLMAAVGRREPRDIVDLLLLHEAMIPLGAVAWAAVEVAPGFTPEGLLAELRRNSRYIQADFDRLDAAENIDAGDIARRLRAAIADAEAFVARMPSEKAGRFFLKNGRVVQPDPDHLDQYVEHGPRRGGHWPTSPEISQAMLERYLRPPEAEPPSKL